jgi:hypothetical protein
MEIALRRETAEAIRVRSALEAKTATSSDAELEEAQELAEAAR